MLADYKTLMPSEATRQYTLLLSGHSITHFPEGVKKAPSSRWKDIVLTFRIVLLYKQ
jgi:hypothetical protein